jgi:hypothetical protein
MSILSQELLLDTFEINRERAIDYLNTRDNVYVFHGFADASGRRPTKSCVPTALLIS